MSDKRQRSVMKAEELDDAITQLLDLAQSEGQALRGAEPGRVFTRRGDTPNIDDLLRGSLRAALESEIVPASQPSGDDSIDPAELHRELIKKALVGLRLSILRQVARDTHVPASGNVEAVVTRVAEAYRWDNEEIARLVLRYEEEPAPDHGFVDRLFPLAGAPDVEDAFERLSLVLGRYVRIGIARWFVFDELDHASGEELSLRGTFRSYQAGVNDIGEEPELSGIPSEQTARVLLTSEPSVLRVRRTSSSAARAAARAIEVTTGISPLGYVRLSPVEQARTSSLDPSSRFMLDLLYTRLRDAGLRNLDLTVARFRVGREQQPEEDDSRRPKLDAVRFEGRHLLDSVAACRLLAEESRALVEIALRVQSPPRSDREFGQFPLRIAIESNHAVVTTGFGTGPIGLSQEVHQAAVNAVIDEMRYGIADEARLEELSTKIEARATATHSPDEADMLGDRESDDVVALVVERDL